MLRQFFAIAFCSIVGLLFLSADASAQIPDIDFDADIQVMLNISPGGTTSLFPHTFRPNFELGETVNIRPFVGNGNNVAVYACIGGVETYLGIAPNAKKTKIKLPKDPSLAGTTITLKFRDRVHAPGTLHVLMEN